MLLLLFGCAIDGDCETTTGEVADDVLLGDLATTAEDLLAGIGGTRRFPAAYRDGGTTAAELTVTRGDGSAVFHDAEWVGGGGGGGLRLAPHDSMLIICNDVVEVPVVVALSTLDGAVGLTMAGVASSQDYSVTDGVPAWVEVRGEGEPATATFDPPLAEGTPPSLGMVFEEGALVSLSLEWTTDTASHLLAWPPVETE